MSVITGTNVTIMVKSMDASIDFYQKIGLTVQNRWGDHYAMLTASGITIGLHPSQETNLGSGSLSIGFMIDSLENAKAMLEKNQIEYCAVEDGKAGSLVHFKDPDGTALYFIIPAKW